MAKEKVRVPSDIVGENDLLEASDIDQEELIRKLDKESSYRKLSGIWDKVIVGILILFTSFQVYTAVTGTFPAQLQRMIHLGFVMCLAFLLYPATKKGRRDRIFALDYVLALAFVGIVLYYLINYDAIINRSGAYNTTDIVVAAIAVILVMEACRRVVGLPIVIIATIFILFAFFGNKIPGFLHHRGFSLSRVAPHLFYTTEGIIGLPLGTCATYIFLFILFGAFLEKTGIGAFFIDLANAIAGHAAGGPAKVAVLTSALQGTISGSSVSNTVSTGSFTIPLMKSLGYKPEFAAAVEAAASTGGQIMPPIMGAAAFLIADAVGEPYFVIAKAAIIPALLYFTGIWMMIDFEAKKLGLVGIPKSQLPKVWPILRDRGHLLLPLIVIIVLLAMDFSPIYAASRGILACIIAPYLRKNTRVPVKALGEAFVNGARNIIGVACACAVAGIIVGIVTLTGLGLKLGGELVSIAGGNMLITLFFTMITSLVLGMGVPTTANYLITSTIAAPIIMMLGVPPLAAHLFAFYFGILADITPPVALAAYAGSAIAGGDPFKTGVQATKLAIAAFIIPYIFVVNPALILVETSVFEVIQILITSLVGMYGIAGGISGYMRGHANPLIRLLLIASGLLLIYPTWQTDILGVAMIIGIYVLQGWMGKKKVLV